MNDVAARTGKLLTYYRAYRVYNIEKNNTEALKKALQKAFGTDSDSEAMLHIEDEAFPVSYIEFLIKEMYSMHRIHSKHILIKFYLCELIYDLYELQYRLTSVHRSLFRTLFYDLIKFEPEERSKDNAILANYYLCLALVCRWFLELELSNLNTPSSEGIMELHRFISQAQDLLKSSEKYAELAKNEFIFSEERLGEVSQNNFLKELGNLKLKLSSTMPKVGKLRTRKIQELFDEFAPDYKKHEQKTHHIAAQEKVLRKILDAIGNYHEGNIKILDIATGPGIIPCVLADVFDLNKIDKIIAIDLSEKMIEQAKKELSPRLAEKCLLTDCDIANFDEVRSKVGDTGFDVVIISFLFAWLSDRKTVFENVRKLTRDGGTMIILEEFFKIGQSKPIFSKEAAKLPCQDELKTLYDYVPIFELIESAKECRFKQTPIQDFSERIDDFHDVVGLVYRAVKS